MTNTDELPPAVPQIKHYQCCTCGGTGLDSHGEICEHCEGFGLC